MNRKLLMKSIFMLLTTGVVLGTILSFSNSEDPRILKILNQIEVFTNRSKLQKVYLKSDKDKYIVGETIWLKAYMLNAISLKPDLSSNELYVDLVNKNNSPIQSIILKNNEGYSTGDLILSDSIPEGNYQLVAYTNWMKNFNESFFFSKTIQVINPGYGKYLTNASLSEIKNFNKQLQTSEKEKIVQFFPESGNLVAGIQSRVAFKASNNLGYGIVAKGDLFDDKNTKICRVESKYLGMGDFYFTPEIGKKYYVRLSFADGSSKNFDLPAVQTNGYVMMVNSIAGDQIRLNIQSNNGSQMDEKNNEFIIVGQSRGEIRYISKGINKGKPINSNIPKKSFPSGIAQITLFNGAGEPVCERLVFIQPKETENKSIINVEKTEDESDWIYKISLTQSNGKPTMGNISLSMYEALNDSINHSWKENIVSNLLLTSDLKGKVENAAGYFDDTNADGIMKLDYVMMINGWRRFIWKEILAGQFQALLYAPSEGLNDDITTTSLKPMSFDLTNKTFLVALNEQYDTKMLRKNTREAMKSNAASRVGASPNIIVMDKSSVNGYNNMLDYMKGRVSGVEVAGNSIRIRGISSINSGTAPLILQDDSPIDNIASISPRDVASIEVLKGSDASFYGVRGANGVIIIHMRKGNEDMKAAKEFSDPTPERIISFYKAREFYVPAYDSWNNKPSAYNVSRSVFWIPTITVDSTGVAIVKIKNRTDVSKITTSIEGLAADGSVLHYEATN